MTVQEEKAELLRLADLADDGPWKFKEKHVDADPDSHVRRAGGEYEDEELDDGGEIVTDWCNNLEYIAYANPDRIKRLLREQRGSITSEDVDFIKSMCFQGPDMTERQERRVKRVIDELRLLAGTQQDR